MISGLVTFKIDSSMWLQFHGKCNDIVIWHGAYKHSSFVIHAISSLIHLFFYFLEIKDVDLDLVDLPDMIVNKKEYS